PQTLSGATAYSYTIPNANSISGVSTLIPRFSCAVSADGTTVYKSTQSSGAWDSDAYSPQGYLNGCFISWRVSSTAYFSLVGLSNNPTSTVSYTKLNFGLEIDSGGNLDIYELGTHIGTFGTYAAGDAFEIRYDGVTARYFHNGALMRAVRAPGLTLYPAICQYSPGAVISNVEFGPSSAVNQPTGSWLNNYPWVIGATGIQGNYADIGGYSASAIYMAGNGGTPLGPYGMSEPLWIAYGGINGANGGWNDNGDLYGIDSSKTYRSTVWVYWNGQGNGQFFHGCDTNGNSCTVGTQTPLGNPYYSDCSLPGVFAPGKWYLAVGILHGSSYTGGNSGISGVYDPLTGQKISSGDLDYNILASAPYQMQRVYH